MNDIDDVMPTVTDSRAFPFISPLPSPPAAFFAPALRLDLN
jgi:hypothetical protein